MAPQPAYYRGPLRLKLRPRCERALLPVDHQCAAVLRNERIADPARLSRALLLSSKSSAAQRVTVMRNIRRRCAPATRLLRQGPAGRRRGSGRSRPIPDRNVPCALVFHRPAATARRTVIRVGSPSTAPQLPTTAMTGDRLPGRSASRSVMLTWRYPTFGGSSSAPPGALWSIWWTAERAKGHAARPGRGHPIGGRHAGRPA